mmetsp:Transcript_1398/g.1823  ORF Transcript_1398/g.1823 Transcript_1398/m.1823 type:complete len:80 (-) Transcript_1398:90-329(-)
MIEHEYEPVLGDEEFVDDEFDSLSMDERRSRRRKRAKLLAIMATTGALLGGGIAALLVYVQHGMTSTERHDVGLQSMSP